MKKKNWISLLLIVLCLGILLGYRELDRIRTDSKAPVITVEEKPLELSALEPRSALLQGVTAADDRDGDVTASLVVESVRLLRGDGTVTVSYAAFDRAGNVAKVQREVRYTDYVRPRFSLSQPLVFTQRNYELLEMVSVQDLLDGDISHWIRATALEDAEVGYSGTYKVLFQVTNSLGDTVELVLPVEIYTPGIQEAKLHLEDYLVYVQAGDTFNARNYLHSFVIGKTEISLRSGVPEELRLTVTGNVDTGVPGIYEVQYRISYTPNRDQPDQVYTAYSKLFVVVEG